MSDIIVKQHIDDLLVTNTLPEAQDVLGIPRHPLTAYWTSTYTTVCSNSADWGLGYNSYTAVAANSANWDSGGGLYSAVVTNSANWDLGYAGYQVVASNNENWDKGYRAYTAVSPNSANWNLAYTGYTAITEASGTWSTVVQEKSARWESTWTTVNLTSSVDVSVYGIIGDSVSDVSIPLQSLFNQKRSNTYYFPAGVYNFNKSLSLTYSGVDIVMHPQAILRVVNRQPSTDNLSIFEIKAGNISIQGGILSGYWNMANQGTPRVAAGIPYNPSILAGLVSVTDGNMDIANIKFDNITFTKSTKPGITMYFQSNKTNPDLPTNDPTIRKIGNFFITNCRFINNVAGVQFVNSRNNSTTPLSATKYIENIVFKNNIISETAKIQPGRVPYEFNSEGIFTFSPSRYGRKDFYITAILGTNRVIIDGFKFRANNIGQTLIVDEVYAPNDKSPGSLGNILLTKTLAVTSVGPGDRAECVLLDGLTNPVADNVSDYFTRFIPSTVKFTTNQQISGDDLWSRSFSIFTSTNTRNGIDPTANFGGNAIGAVGPLKNIIIEENTIKEIGRHALEFYNSTLSLNTVVRKNHFINVPNYTYSYGGKNQSVTDNIHENCNPTIELYGVNNLFENNYFDSGCNLVTTWVGGGAYEFTTFRNNYIVNTSPFDVTSLGDNPFGFDTSNLIIENNFISFPNGIQSSFPQRNSTAFLNFEFTENSRITNNTVTVVGLVSSFYPLSIPRLVYIGGNNIEFASNRFYLSGNGNGYGKGTALEGWSTLGPLFNSTVKNNIVSTNEKIELQSGFPLWGFRYNQTRRRSVVLYDQSSRQNIIVRLSGFPGQVVDSHYASPLPKYPLTYNIGDTYGINTYTDFTQDSTNKFYLSAWNNNRNRIARYVGSGNWNYYDIADVLFVKSTDITNILYSELDYLMTKALPVGSVSPGNNNCFLIASDRDDQILANVTLENNNFTWYDAVSSNYFGNLQKGLYLMNPILFNTNIINSKDSVAFRDPLLSINSVTDNRLNSVYNTVNTLSSSMWTNVKLYGAKGDGVTNDYHSIMTAFQRVTANGGTVYFPPGNYRIQELIYISRNLAPFTILGDGANSIITAASAMSAIGIPNFGGNPNFGANNQVFVMQFNNANNITIKNIKINGNGSIQPVPTGDGVPVEMGGRPYYNGTKRAKHSGLRFDYSKNLLLDNVILENHQLGSVGFYGCSAIGVYNCRFETQTYRWPLTGTLGRTTTEYYADRSDYTSGPGAGLIYAGGGSQLVAVGAGKSALNDFTCRNCYFKDWQYDAIGFGLNDASYPNKNVEVSDCTFENISSSVFAIEAINTGAFTGLSSYFANQTYSRNRFINSKSSFLEGGTGISVVGNNITINDNVWVDDSPFSQFDTWRRGIEIAGCNINITNNELQNSQIHFTGNSNNYSGDFFLSSANVNISNNILRSRLSVSSSGTGMIYLKSEQSQSFPKIDGVSITNNFLQYTIPSNQRMINIVGPYTNLLIANNTFKSPIDYTQTAMAGTAISFSNASSASDVLVVNNIIDGVSTGIALPHPVSTAEKRNIIVKGNYIKTSPVGYRQNNAGIYLNFDSKSATASGDATNTLLLTSGFTIQPGVILSQGTANDSRPFTVVNTVNSSAPLITNPSLTAYDTTVTVPFPWSVNSNRSLGMPTDLANDLTIIDNVTYTGGTKNSPLTSRREVMTENFARWRHCEISELVTLSADVIDTRLRLLPENSIIKSVVLRTIVPPGNVDTYDIGTPTNPTRFATSANIHLSAPNPGGRLGRVVCLNHWPLSSTQITPQSIRFTLDKSPTKWGVVRVTTFFEDFEAPTT